MTAHALSPRMREVLVYAARGYTSRETADAIGLAVATVRTLRESARIRLGARSITHAVAMMLMEGR